MPALLVTGTDTEVGKTVLVTALAAYWQHYCGDRPGSLLKLVQTGVGDRELYERLFGDVPCLQLAAPVTFETPAAPPIAAALAGETVDLQSVWAALAGLQETCDFTFVEALGGLGSPVTEELTVADIAALWKLPVVLVVPVKLGAIAQVVANVALARQAGVDLRGIVLNCAQPQAEAKLDLWAPRELLVRLTQVPVLGLIPHLDQPTDLGRLAQVASDLELETLLPLLPLGGRVAR
ncbi:MAG: dethiobiotin synthase [Cyanobacteria bacterium J06641_5]